MISDETKNKGFTEICLIEEAKFGDDLLLNYMMQCGHAKKMSGYNYDMTIKATSGKQNMKVFFVFLSRLFKEFF